MNREKQNKDIEEFEIFVNSFVYNMKGCMNALTCALKEAQDKQLKKNTREDNSDECWYDLDTHIWAYINPFNKKQRMWVDEIGFNVETIDDTWTSNKEDGIKSVWQKVERIDELTDGDFVRVWNDELDKKHISNKGIITNIIFKNRFEYHYYNNTPDYYNNKSRILSIEIDFNDNWKNVEKAVLEGCQE
jgi:hypothetical protein